MDTREWDVVRKQGFWDNGKWIPMDLASMVKEILAKETTSMKAKMQGDMLKSLESI